MSRGFPGQFSDYDFRAKIGGGAFRIAGNSPGSDRAGAGPNITVEGSRAILVMPDGTRKSVQVARIKGQGTTGGGEEIYRDDPSSDWMKIPDGAKIFRHGMDIPETQPTAPHENKTPDYAPKPASEPPAKPEAAKSAPAVLPSDGGQVSPADPASGGCGEAKKIIVSESPSSASIGTAESGLARCDHEHALAPSDINGVFSDSPTILKSFSGGLISFSIKDGIIPPVPSCGTPPATLDGTQANGNCDRYAASDHKHAIDVASVMSAAGYERQTISFVKGVRLESGGLVIEYGAITGFFEEGTDQPDSSIIPVTDCGE